MVNTEVVEPETVDEDDNSITYWSVSVTTCCVSGLQFGLVEFVVVEFVNDGV
jgi:hypothetical protein